MSIFGEIFKVTLAPFFIPDFISLSCELDNFVCTRLFWVILHWYYVKAKWKCSTLTVPHEKFIMVSFAFSIMKKVVLFTSLSKRLIQVVTKLHLKFIQKTILKRKNLKV